MPRTRYTLDQYKQDPSLPMTKGDAVKLLKNSGFRMRKHNLAGLPHMR